MATYDDNPTTLDNVRSRTMTGYEALAYATGVRADGTEERIYGNNTFGHPLSKCMAYASTYFDRDTVKGTSWEFVHTYVTLVSGETIAYYYAR